MTRALAVCAVLAAACYQRVALDDGGTSSDGTRAGSDGGMASGDASAGCTTIGTAAFATACVTVTAGSAVLEGFDTTSCVSQNDQGMTVTGQKVAVGAGSACVFAFDTLLASQRATGSLPLIVFGASSLEVQNLSASSTTSSSGPGALASQHPCSTATPPQGNAGGAGGAYQSAGGDGGAAEGNGGVDEEMFAASFATGCSGQLGGGAAGSVAAPGGVVYAISKSEITATGTIDADGAGGRGGAAGGPEGHGNGGNGGGAGGLIALSAPALRLQGASLIAIGAGGGAGGTGLGSGMDAPDPNTVTFSAPGGTGGTGAAGGSGATVAENPGGHGAIASNDAGGGGGGGGCGHILLFGTIATEPLITAPEVEGQ